MKRVQVLWNVVVGVATVIVMVATTSCSDKIKGEGGIFTRDFEVATSTSGISVGNSMKLTLSDNLEVGELSIIAYENIHQYIRVTDAAGRLTIELDNNNYSKLDIEIIAPSKQYNSIEAAGASEVVQGGKTIMFDNYDIVLTGASKFYGDIEVANSVTMELSGASTFSGDIEAENLVSMKLKGASKVYGDIVADKSLSVDLSGASYSNISGSTVKCSAKLEGASNLFDTSFSCDDLSIDLSGASSVRMRVYDYITGELSGSSKIQYKGSPSISLDMSGSSFAENL